ncbi:hypothetical protein [Ferruginibacter sp.]|nr:hypothetical protein [Ferruginibacter sp.]
MKQLFYCLVLLTTFTLCSDFTSAQSRFRMSVNNGTTRVQIGETLAFDIVGQYPQGSFPTWEKINEAWGMPIINSIRMATVGFENFNIRNSSVEQVYELVVLTKKDDKPILIVGDYYAEIETGGSMAVLTNKPQRFPLVNFRSRRRIDEPVENSKKPEVKGGAKGTIELSANDKGDINLSFVVEYFRVANGSLPAGLSFRYSLTNMLCQNLYTAGQANVYAANLKKAKTEDSLHAIINQKKYADQSRLFEIKIKNSLQNVAASLAKYPTTNNYSCLKKETELYEVPGTREKVIGEMRYTAEGVAMGTADYYKEKPGYTETREITKNSCSKSITVKGISKKQSDKGTIYYEDATFTLPPGETISGDIIIKESYDPTNAKIGSTHYFKNKLIVK